MPSPNTNSTVMCGFRSSTSWSRSSPQEDASPSNLPAFAPLTLESALFSMGQERATPLDSCCGMNPDRICNSQESREMLMGVISDALELVHDDYEDIASGHGRPRSFARPSSHTSREGNARSQ